MALYRHGDPDLARARVEQLIAALRGCPIGELARLGRTLHAWRVELLAHFDHPDVSNGPTENLNLKIKNTKRIAHGCRNFDHYRLRLFGFHGRSVRGLLHCWTGCRLRIAVSTPWWSASTSAPLR